MHYTMCAYKCHALTNASVHSLLRGSERTQWHSNVVKQARRGLYILHALSAVFTRLASSVHNSGLMHVHIIQIHMNGYISHKEHIIYIHI